MENSEEINAVTDFIKNNSTNKELAEKNNEEVNLDFQQITSGDFGDSNSNEEDEMYDEAMNIVREAKKASASLLQRRLKIGYARAARLLDIMEANGAIGPGDGAKPREVFLGEESV